MRDKPIICKHVSDIPASAEFDDTATHKIIIGVDTFLVQVYHWNNYRYLLLTWID